MSKPTRLSKHPVSAVKAALAHLIAVQAAVSALPETVTTPPSIAE